MRSNVEMIVKKIKVFLNLNENIIYLKNTKIV